MSRTKLIAAVCGATMLVGLSACDSGGGEDPAPEPPSEDTSAERIPIDEAVQTCMDSRIEMLKSSGDTVWTSPVGAVSSYVEEGGSWMLYMPEMSWFQTSDEDGEPDSDIGLVSGFKCDPDPGVLSVEELENDADIPAPADEDELVTWNKESAESTWRDTRDWLNVPVEDQEDKGYGVGTPWATLVKEDPYAYVDKADAPSIPGLN